VQRLQQVNLVVIGTTRTSHSMMGEMQKMKFSGAARPIFSVRPLSETRMSAFTVGNRGRRQAHAISCLDKQDDRHKILCRRTAFPPRIHMLSTGNPVTWPCIYRRDRVSGGISSPNGAKFTEYSPFTRDLHLRTLGERCWKQYASSFAYLEVRKLELERQAWRSRDSTRPKLARKPKHF
jgi:hypothetical protein